MTYLIKIGREAMVEKLIAYGNKNFSLSASVGNPSQYNCGVYSPQKD